MAEPKDEHYIEKVWRDVFEVGSPELRSYQDFNRRLPSPPRCKLCFAPYAGFGSFIMALQGRRPSSRNPRYCSRCDSFLRAHPGGAVVVMSFAFVDVRSSVQLGARLTTQDFSRAMTSFYNAVTRVLNQTDGFIIDLVGDEVVAVYPPGFSGPDHARKAIDAARQLLELSITAPDGTRLHLGIGVNTGEARIGTVTASEVGIEDIAAQGDAVNVVARLAAAAAPDEALITEASCTAAGIDQSDLERREVVIKGHDAPVWTRVLREPIATLS